MATNHECPVLEASMTALDLSQPAAAENSHQSVDVVDLLPGPIWHIIFRHLLQPPADSTQQQQQDDSDEELSSGGADRLLSSSQGEADSGLCELIDLQQQDDPLAEAGSFSWLSTSHLSEREKHKEYARRFGSSWPLLRCAMASKRLLHHVMSFSDVEPLSLAFKGDEPEWRGVLSWFLQQPGHKSLVLVFSSPENPHDLGRLMASSAQSLTNLCVRVNEFFPYGVNTHPRINTAFLEGFGQLQQLKLGLGDWELGSVNAAWFKALRSLTIEHSDSKRCDLGFLSSIAPQLHEFSLSSSSFRHFCSLRLDFLSARAVTVKFEEQELEVCFSLAPSLKAFSVAAAELNVNCNSDSPLSLDSLTLIGRRCLVIASLPLASAKNVYLNGPTSLVQPSAPLDELYNHPSISRRSLTASQHSLTQLLRSIAPTVETLIVRHGSPLEEVRAEWICLRCLAIGANGTGIGFKFMITVKNDGSPHYWMRVFSPGGRSSSSSSSSGHEGIRPPVINAPKLESIFFATQQWQPDTLASLHSDFPSLTFYCIVDQSFCWEGKGEDRDNEPVVQLRPDHPTHLLDKAACVDDRIMQFLQVL